MNDTDLRRRPRGRSRLAAVPLIDRRARGVLGLTAGALALWTVGLAVESVVLAPRSELTAAVARAERRWNEEQRLLSRSDQIESRFLRIAETEPDSRDSVLTESKVLGRLVTLSGPRVRVDSIVPRRGARADHLHVSLDFEGSLAAVADYVDTILDHIPATVTRLTMAAHPDGAAIVTCRLSIEVMGLGD